MRLPQSMMGRLSRSTGSAARPGWAHISTEKCYRITDVLNEQGPPLKERITSGWFCKTTQRLTCASSRSSRVGLATPSLVVFPWATSRMIRHAPGYGRPSLPDAGYWLVTAGAKRGNRRLPHHRHQAVSQASSELTTIPGTHSASPFKCPAARDTAL